MWRLKSNCVFLKNVSHSVFLLRRESCSTRLRQNFVFKPYSRCEEFFWMFRFFFVASSVDSEKTVKIGKHFIEKGNRTFASIGSPESGFVLFFFPKFLFVQSETWAASFEFLDGSPKQLYLSTKRDPRRMLIFLKNAFPSTALVTVIDGWDDWKLFAIFDVLSLNLRRYLNL